MKYLLDTNVCIAALTQRNPLFMKRFLSYPASDKVICSIVCAELFYGVYKSQQPVASGQRISNFLKRFISLPFDDQSAQVNGEIRALLARQGTPIGPYDNQIAAIALANHLTLVTHNTREFQRVPNLLLEDWEI